MKVYIKREVILSPLLMVCGVIERRHNLPILSNVLIETQEDGFFLTATDLEVELHTKITGGSAEQERLTVSGGKLLSIFRALPEGSDVTLEKKQDRMTIRCGKSYFDLTTMPAEDFPSLTDIETERGLDLPSKDLKRLLERTQFAMAQQDVRFYLNGLLMDMQEARLIGVATDGHRLAMSELPLDQAMDGRCQVIIPRKGVQELARLLADTGEPVRLRVGTNHIQASVGDRRLTAKLIDATFPDYDRVIPSDNDKAIVVEKRTFREALIRMAILSNEKFKGVRLHFSQDGLMISARNPEQESSQEELEIEYQGEDFEVGFNVSYLLDALGAIDTESINIELSDPDRGILIKAANESKDRYVVMPMRL